MRPMIEPEVVDVTIQRYPAKAFELFTSRLADWWPLDTHSLGASEKKIPATVIMEPHTGGRIYEVSPMTVSNACGARLPTGSLAIASLLSGMSAALRKAAPTCPCCFAPLMAAEPISR